MAIIATSVIQVMCQQNLGATAPAVAIFLLAIGFSAWYGGFGAGLLAMVLAVPTGDLLTVAMDPNATMRTRIVDGAAVVVVGMLTNAMLLYRETQARITMERRHHADERRRTADDLTQERHRLLMLMEHSPDRIYFKDLQSRFVVISPSMARMFGYDRVEDVLGKSDFDIFTQEHAQPAFDDEQQIIRTGIPLIDKEEKETWPDGHITWASSTKVPFRDPQGNVIGTFGISRDITQRKLADDALRKAKVSAEAANLAKSQFLANMSHEIRTPLSAVVGMAEILLDSGLTPEQREFAEIIHKSGNGLVAMLNDILDYSKIEAGKLKLETIPFDLALAVDDVVHLLAANAEAKGLELIQRVAPGTPVRLMGDPSRLRQVLSNLIVNAIKFTEKGHVFVDVTGEPVGDSAARVRVEVSDTGIGIASDKLGQIFDKFTQADTSTTRRYGGTGLGLAICRQIAESMGGTLRVDSQPEQGSTFKLALTLPIAPGSSPKLPIQIDLSGTHVLVVESSAITRRVIAEQLSAWGCVPHCHARGEEALTESTVCRLAVIDAQLGDVAGLDLGRSLRASVHGKDLGLILLTSIGQRGDAKLAEDAGFNAYLVKPVRSLDLRDALAEVVQAQQFGDLQGLVTRHTLAERRGHSSSDVHRRGKETKDKQYPI
ncbi:MAG TPA: ATP-binding protein [Planctomycetota bacterium]|nr:ATP-binding protein [Planctomycetota bacterium]